MCGGDIDDVWWRRALLTVSLPCPYLYLPALCGNHSDTLMRSAAKEKGRRGFAGRSAGNGGSEWRNVALRAFSNLEETVVRRRGYGCCHSATRCARRLFVVSLLNRQAGDMPAGRDNRYGRDLALFCGVTTGGVVRRCFGRNASIWNCSPFVLSGAPYQSALPRASGA